MDYHLLRAEMNGLDFDHRVLQPWANNPAFYVTVVADESTAASRQPGGMSTPAAPRPVSDVDAASFQSVRPRLFGIAYRVLGLMSFLTAGEKEARAWTIPQGSRAQDAAGTIHSDIARGFIRAEIVGYDQLMRAGSYVAAKEQGLMRLEGKDYIMQEGDVVNFRFNV